MASNNNLRAAPFKQNQIQDILDKKITAFIYPFKDRKNETILKLYKYGDVRVNGRSDIIPSKESSLSSIEFIRRGNIVRYNMTNGRRLSVRVKGNISKFYVKEKYLNMSDYGLSGGLIYALDNGNNPISYKTLDGDIVPLRFTKTTNAETSRIILASTDYKLKHLLDVTEAEAHEMGYKPTDEWIKFPDGIKVRMDKENTSRNAFFLDHKDELLDNPLVFVIKFKVEVTSHSLL